MIYSGVYDNKADATKALKPLKSKFPDAKVVQVSAKAAAVAVARPSARPRPERPDERQRAAATPP